LNQLIIRDLGCDWRIRGDVILITVAVIRMPATAIVYVFFSSFSNGDTRVPVEDSFAGGVTFQISATSLQRQKPHKNHRSCFIEIITQRDGQTEPFYYRA